VAGARPRSRQPYLRFDTDDHLDPRFAERRVEPDQHRIAAIALDCGELVARHARSIAGHLTLTDPAHQRSSIACAPIAGRGLRY